MRLIIILILTLTLSLALTASLVGCESGAVSQDTADIEYNDCMDICMADNGTFEPCKTTCEEQRFETIDSALKVSSAPAGKLSQQDASPVLSTDSATAETPYATCMSYCMSEHGHTFEYCHNICKDLVTPPEPVEDEEVSSTDKKGQSLNR